MGLKFNPVTGQLDLVGSGSGGAVDSVNGQTGTVVLDAQDVLPDETGNSGKFLTTDGSTASWGSPSGGGDMMASTYDPNSVASDAFDMDNMEQGTTNKFVTASDITNLSNLSGTNTGDQDLSALAIDSNVVHLSGDESISDTKTFENLGVSAAITTDINITGDGSSGTSSSNPRVSWGVETGGNNNAHGEINSPTGGVAYLDFTTVGVDYQMRLGWFDSDAEFEMRSPDGTIYTIDQQGNSTQAGDFIGSGIVQGTQLVASGSNGNVSINADTDGGDYNFAVDNSGTLAFFGSDTATLGINLLDGDLQTNSTTRLTNSGTLENVTWNGNVIGSSYGGAGTSNGILQANGSGTVSAVTVGTGLSFSGGTLSSTVNGFTWNNITGTSQSASVNNGYIANNSSLVTVTLPSTAAIGSVVRVAGAGAGGWKLAQNSGQTVNFGSSATTSGTGGSLASINRYDAVEVICITANSGWAVISAQGNLTVT